MAEDLKPIARFSFLNPRTRLRHPLSGLWTKITMEAEEVTEATLELTLLSTDLRKKPKLSPFAVAWIDPSLKKSTKTLDHSTILHFPLSPPILRNPSSIITIEILSPRLPFCGPKLLGAAALPLTSLRLGETRTLHLRKPSSSSSDRSRGTIHVATRILWCLGVPEPAPDFPGAGCGNGADFPYVAHPSAPPMPEVWGGGGFQDFLSDDPATAPPMIEDGSGDCDCESVDSRELRMMSERDDHDASTSGGGSDGDRIELIKQLNKRDETDGMGALRSFLVGLASGAVAAVLVGAVGYSEG